MQTLWNTIEKLAPLVLLQRELALCAPVCGLEDFFNEEDAQRARRAARQLAREVARRHYRSHELTLVLQRLDEGAENDLVNRKIRRVYWAIADQIRKRHTLPRTDFVATPPSQAEEPSPEPEDFTRKIGL